MHFVAFHIKKSHIYRTLTCRQFFQEILCKDDLYQIPDDDLSLKMNLAQTSFPKFNELTLYEQSQQLNLRAM